MSPPWGKNRRAALPGVTVIFVLYMVWVLLHPRFVSSHPVHFPRTCPQQWRSPSLRRIPPSTHDPSNRALFSALSSEGNYCCSTVHTSVLTCYRARCPEARSPQPARRVRLHCRTRTAPTRACRRTRPIRNEWAAIYWQLCREENFYTEID